MFQFAAFFYERLPAVILYELNDTAFAGREAPAVDAAQVGSSHRLDYALLHAPDGLQYLYDQEAVNHFLPLVIRVYCRQHILHFRPEVLPSIGSVGLKAFLPGLARPAQGIQEGACEVGCRMLDVLRSVVGCSLLFVAQDEFQAQFVGQSERAFGHACL